MRDERALALELDRALAGEDAGAEALELAALLVAAAEPARFEVSGDELERALAGTRPARRRAPRPRIALVLAAALAAAAVAFALLRPAGLDVQARAARALDHTFYVVERVVPARRGLFVPTASIGYLDPARGLGHWRVSAGGQLVAETAVDGARVTRYDASSNTITIAESCRAFASGCSEVLDPIDLYRRTVDGPGSRADKTSTGWRLTIRGGGAAGVEQVVTIDGKTYLPTRIDWRDRGKTVSIVRIVTLMRAPADEDYTLAPHPGARVRHLTAGGLPVRKLSERPTRAPRGALWLGRSYEGIAARTTRVHYNAGDAVRIAYGPIAVWNYDRFVPPGVSEGAIGAVKTIELTGGGVARIFFGSGGALVAEIQARGGTAAIVSTVEGKEDVLRALDRLRPVR